LVKHHPRNITAQFAAHGSVISDENNFKYFLYSECYTRNMVGWFYGQKIETSITVTQKIQELLDGP
jgi:hypothetical protein